MAMPTHAMSCFRLSKGQCQTLTSTITQFWWQQEEDKKKINWVSWKNLCKKKEEGGLGFRDFQRFNQALLAKQGWRIISYPDSILARLYKDRYFPNDTFLIASRGKRPSYAWQSILFGRELLLKGLRKHVATGSSTSVWNENWLLDGIPSSPKGPGKDLLPDLTVADLMHQDTATWNINLLEILVDPMYIPMILAVIPSHEGQDVYTWSLEKSGSFTVKSAYWLATHDVTDEFYIQASAQPSLNPLFGLIWKTKTEPKIRIFLWKVLVEALPVASRLQSRGMEIESLCKLCEASKETICHVLFTCPVAKLIWTSSNYPINIMEFSESALFSNVHSVFQAARTRDGSTELRKCFPWILWEIWKNRNNVIFKNLRTEPMEVANKAQQDALLWSAANKSQNENEHPSVTTNTNKTWSPSSYSQGLKCNFDFSWVDGADYCGAAWILRDSQGNALCHSRHAFLNPETWIQAAALSCSWTIKSLSTLGYNNIEFETDSTPLHAALLNPDHWISLSNILNDAPQLLKVCQENRLLLCSSSANRVAKALARSVTLWNLFKTYVSRGHCQWFKPLLDIDKPLGH